MSPKYFILQTSNTGKVKRHCNLKGLIIIKEVLVHRYIDFVLHQWSQTIRNQTDMSKSKERCGPVRAGPGKGLNTSPVRKELELFSLEKWRLQVGLCHRTVVLDKAATAFSFMQELLYFPLRCLFTSSTSDHMPQKHIWLAIYSVHVPFCFLSLAKECSLCALANLLKISA